MDTAVEVQRYADQFAALGSEARLRVLRLLLSCHPHGMIVGQIQAELGIAHSTLSHHLEKLRQEELVVASREGTAWRYRAHADSLKAMLEFLLGECCTRNAVVDRSSLEVKKESCCDEGRG